MDKKISSSLSIAFAKKPRASLNEIAKFSGISKATLYRISSKRDELIKSLATIAANNLKEALVKSQLYSGSYDDGIRRLTKNIIDVGPYYIFWNSYKWTDISEGENDFFGEVSPSFYAETLEDFFLSGQKAGFFQLEMSAKWLANAYEYLLFAAIESAYHGQVAKVGIEYLVTETFLRGVCLRDN
ncbi:hypothetical protein ACPFTX_002647 [Vibrio cholerae]